jgi:hypothetical protein
VRLMAYQRERWKSGLDFRSGEPVHRKQAPVSADAAVLTVLVCPTKKKLIRIEIRVNQSSRVPFW